MNMYMYSDIRCIMYAYYLRWVSKRYRSTVAIKMPRCATESTTLRYAKFIGAEVYATAGADEKHEFLRSLGVSWRKS